MSIQAILIGTAARVGAPIVKRLLEQHLGRTAGTIAGTVIDAIAGEAGVTPAELEQLPPHQLDRAVSIVEKEAPELISAYVAQQREANRLMLAELEKSETTFTWAWRPAWMWLLGVFWIWSLVLVPAVNAATGAAIPLYLGELATLTVVYTGLYLGGHTVKDFAAKKWTSAPHG